MDQGSRIFTYEEALETFPTVRELTDRAIHRIRALYNGIQSREEMERRQPELEAATSQVIESWTQEVASMGCLVKGLWLVDWDCGDGFYCWRYPEVSIGHFHGYEEGFNGRMPIN
jgi:hypothetical protein